MARRRYKGITDTTRHPAELLVQDRSPAAERRKFTYHYFQREAVETLIYLYEVAKVRRHKNLVETFATRSDLRLLQYDDFARYCVKMATAAARPRSCRWRSLGNFSTRWPRRATISRRPSC